MTKDIMEVIKGKSRSLSIVSIVLGLIIVVFGLQGELQSKVLHLILGVIILISGVMIISIKNLSTLREIGTRLIAAGWFQLPTALSGFLLTPGPYYREGLSSYLVAILMIVYILAALNGFYILLYANKETGVPMAP